MFALLYFYFSVQVLLVCEFILAPCEDRGRGFNSNFISFLFFCVHVFYYVHVTASLDCLKSLKKRFK